MSADAAPAASELEAARARIAGTLKELTVTEGDQVKAGQRIVVLFYFHQSTQFTPDFLVQTPHHRNESLGVFSICSPVRPNPIGMSIVEVLGVEGCTIHIKGLDMLDGTPVLDIKPVTEKETTNR